MRASASWSETLVTITKNHDEPQTLVSAIGSFVSNPLCHVVLKWTHRLCTSALGSVVRGRLGFRCLAAGKECRIRALGTQGLPWPALIRHKRRSSGSSMTLSCTTGKQPTRPPTSPHTRHGRPIGAAPHITPSADLFSRCASSAASQGSCVTRQLQGAARPSRWSR